MENILISGVCGRIGSAACELLVQNKYANIVGLDIAPTLPTNIIQLKSKITFYHGSLTDYELLLKILKDENISIIVHLAAVPDDAEPSILLPPNVTGVALVLKAVAAINTKNQIKRLIIASSGKLYCGYNSVTTPLKIDAPYSPRCLYGATKAFAEAAAESFALSSKLPTILLRFAWCPRTLADVEAMKQITEKGLGKDEFLSPRDAASCIYRACSVELPSDFVYAPLFVQSNPPPGRNGRFDISNTTKLLNGWQPKDTFPAGIEEICKDRIMNVQLKKRESNGYNIGVKSDDGLYLRLLNTKETTNGRNILQHSVKQRVSAEEWQLRIELAACYRVFAALKWTHLIHTHITVKVPSDDPNEELFLINPYGLSWHEITASSLIKVKADGGIVDPGSTNRPINPAGFKIHSAIHVSKRGKVGGDILWTMHTHTPEVVSVSCRKEGLICGLSQYAMDLGQISYHEFEHATKEGSDVCKRLVDDLGPVNKVILLRNHGPITVGKTVHEAFFLMYQLVEACRVQINVFTNQNSSYYSVDKKIVEETYKIVQNNYTGEPFGKLEWLAAKRKMELEQGLGYKE